MKRIAVYVATTGGPVRIERITPERAPQSMVCLRRTSTILPISGDYDDFVRPGSGVIEREFGPFEDNSFRLDVAAPIGTGRSWQLGIFVAHAIVASKDHALAGDGMECDHAVVVTGQVDYDLTVEAVDHILEKIAGLVETFAPNGEGSVQLIVPSGNNYDVAAASLPAAVTLVPAASAWDACRAIGLQVPDSASRVVAKVTPRPPASPRKWGLAIVAILAAGGISIALAAYPNANVSSWTRYVTDLLKTGNEAAMPATKPGEANSTVALKTDPVASTLPNLVPSELQIQARRPSVGQTCADVHFGDGAVILEPIPKNSQGGYDDSRLESVCGLSFAVTVTGEARYAALLFYIHTGKQVRGEAPPPVLRGATPLSGLAEWSIALPRRLNEPFSYRLVLIESAQSLAAQDDDLRNKPIDETVIRALIRKGVAVQTIDHRVVN